MTSRALHTLKRLRDAARDDARRDVAEAQAQSDRAEAAYAAAERSIHTETAIAARSDTDADVEGFARWLTRARARLRAAEQEVADAAATIAARRAALNLARGLAEATDAAITREADDELQRLDRVAQREQDEIGHRSPGHMPRPARP